jgi:hypothetical protein
VRRKHDGILMQRKMRKKLVARMGVGGTLRPRGWVVQALAERDGETKAVRETVWQSLLHLSKSVACPNSAG